MAVNLVPAIKSCSVYVSYDRPVASARLYWRPAGGSWKPGLDTWNDGARFISCLYRLNPASSYEVRVTFADGTQEQASFTTLPSRPPDPISRVYVSPTGDDAGTGSEANPFRTIARAMQAVTPGTAIMLLPGTYNEVVAPKRAGTVSAWCHLMGADPANRPVLQGGAYDGRDLVIFTNRSSPYWHLENLTFRESLGIHILSTAPDLWIDSCRLEKWNRQVRDLTGGIYIVGSSGRVRILDCEFDGQNDIRDVAHAIFLGGPAVGQVSILGCRTNFRNSKAKDFVMTYPEDRASGGWVKDGEFAENHVEGQPDDGVQFEGGALCVRSWDNVFIDCFRIYGLSPVALGPLWIIRDKALITSQYYSNYWAKDVAAWLKIGNANHNGPIFLYNNTFYADSPNKGHTGAQRDRGPYPNTFTRNNLIVASGRIAYGWFDGVQDWNWDALSTRKLNGYLAQLSVGGNKQSLAEVQSATGQELQGVQGPTDPSDLLVNPLALDFTPRATSVVVDRGTIIRGVSDEFSGAAPDIGAVEMGGPAPTPTARFSANPLSGYVPLKVSFLDESLGSITGRQWDFGDGGASTEQNPAYTYGQPGNYTVTLTVTGPGGSHSTSRTIQALQVAAPLADFDASPTSGPTPLMVSFTNKSIGNITSYSWDFGASVASTQVSPNHTYSTPGDYKVKLTVVGPGGSSTKEQTIIAEEPVPLADFSPSQTDGWAPLMVSFTNKSIGNITGLAWNFGDGVTSGEANPTHIYTSPGQYEARLTVVGPGGSGDHSVLIIVLSGLAPAPLTATLTVLPTLPPPGGEIGGPTMLLGFSNRMRGFRGRF